MEIDGNSRRLSEAALSFHRPERAAVDELRRSCFELTPSLETAVRYLAYDLGSRNIRVNAISAGPIKTLAARGVGALGDMLKAHADRSPLHRNVDQLEVGGTALYLASDLSSAVTGEIIYVDCGYNVMGF